MKIFINKRSNTWRQWSTKMPFYKFASSKYCVSISKFRNPPPQQCNDERGKTSRQQENICSLPTLFVILIARFVAWSQPSTFIKLTCSWRSLIFTNVHLEVNMEQNGWFERYFDVLYTCLCQYFETFTTTDIRFKLFDNARTVMYYWRWTVSIITQLGGLKKNK